MITDPKTVTKVKSLLQRYEKFRFELLAELACEKFETTEFLRELPENASWTPLKKGAYWGDEKVTAWVRAEAVAPAGSEDKKIFLRSDFESRGQTFIKVNDNPLGAFDPFHPAVMIDSAPSAGKKYEISLEAYSFHSYPGHSPNCQPTVITKTSHKFHGLELVAEREDVSAFVFDLTILLDLLDALDKKSAFYGQIMKAVRQVFGCVFSMPTHVAETEWRPKLASAREIMAPLLAAKNGTFAPKYGMIGNSHIDTAWLWPLSETVRKCARTFSSIANLCDEFPEFRFIQSAPCHAAMMQKHYPQVFEKLKAKIKSGNIEPNGAMWVEPDANITSGESFVRQFLVGHKTTKELFDYQGDTLWLPDVFGYSAALPQIMKGCNVKYFCTQKISWNDTTKFPYELFYWQGIDGTKVLSHFLYDYIIEPTPKNMIEGWNNIQHPDSQESQLVAFGWGDGGGGPTREQLQLLRRMKDLQDVPKCEYTTVSDFMRSVEEKGDDLPNFVGELYLETHRGTLTSIAGIKRGNRFSEIALRNCEIVSVLAQICDMPYPKDELLQIWKDVLTNQFHDILPGSSIAIVNDEALALYSDCLAKLKALTTKALIADSGPSGSNLLCFNSLSWQRNDAIVFEANDLVPADDDIDWQQFVGLDGQKKTVINNLALQPFSSEIIKLKPKTEDCPKTSSPFEFDGKKIETPFASIVLDDQSGFKSFWDIEAQREIVLPNRSINEFLMGEDVPSDYDNWDIDIDLQLKLEKVCTLIERQVVSQGTLQLRIRSKYALTPTSTIYQDMVFHANSPQIDFETKIEWHEKYQFLKVAIPLDLHVESARHEIQYGHLERSTHRNRPLNVAQFEAVQHKWSDLSEGGYGVAILNDSKYGNSTNGSDLQLSLLKSGVHPDQRGDAGTHYCTYSILPHQSGFSAEAAVLPAYQLNMPVLTELVDDSVQTSASMLSIDQPNVIVEAVKMAEEDQAFVIRLYESGNLNTNATLTLNLGVAKVVETNMLEEPIAECDLIEKEISFNIKPFEIKTFKCYLK